ncbi:hypothetical protein HB364_26415 [Pseudoflavitalea sp. X16]|uniref:hypothetical protein n=1 Tax=Paraflavitalea devenefica TaxID=2716334 RepID=UPI0014218126|nr:hypothetical protein [Paraflavitalea devenefica]NII28645.1 hypothetical protein [Paraflavitalea devenefica]
MAKVISPFQIRGSIGDLTFFVNEFGQQVKAKSGPTEWHIKNKGSFKNAHRTAAEWKRATAAAQRLRVAMGSLLDGVKNMRLSGRMIAQMLKVIQADPVHDWGEREIEAGDPSVLTGFEFNHNLSLDDALPLNVENCYTVDAGKVSLQIPAFRLRKKKVLPPKATHYRLVSCMLTVDFDNRRSRQDKQESPLLAMGRQSGAPFCPEHVLASDAPGCFWLLGIKFYTMENDKPVLLKGGALRVMQWMGPACVEEVGVAEEGAQKEVSVKEEPVMQEEPVVAPLTTTTPTSTPVVQFNYVSNGQQSGNVVYQVGQQEWYGTSSRVQ